MIFINQKNNKGFVALMSAIIISVVLLLITTNLSLTGFYDRSNILDSELKDRSSALAEACVDTAILNMVQGTTYIGSVNVGADTCTIQSVTGSNQKTILIQAKYSNYYTNLKVVANTVDGSIVSWQEI
ncbi:MAG: hypothetical protein KGL67_02160 [Patescibacteria group bacterium]|nr:hypothetical protein [Patescibacteria group bacterium]